MTKRQSSIGLVLFSSVATLLVGLKIGPVPLRVIFAAPLIFYIPGLVVQDRLFKYEQTAKLEAGVLRVSLSIAVCILITLLLGAVHIPLNFNTWLVVFGATTVVGTAVVALRLIRDTKTVSQNGNRFDLRNVRASSLIVSALGLAILICAIVVGFTPLPPPPTVSGYTQLSMVQSARGRPVKLEVTSYEFKPAKYHLMVRVDSQPIRSYNDLDLSTGMHWSRIIAVPARAARVEAQLFRASDKTPYRTVYLYTSKT